MQQSHVKTHSDGIWISADREMAIIHQCNQVIEQSGWQPRPPQHKNFGYPFQYDRDHQSLHCRFVDSVFLEQPDALTTCQAVITDNVPLTVAGPNLLLPLPEFWSIWQFDPVYESRPATWAFNCFMHRARGDRNTFFYELLRRNLLQQGLVSYNCSRDEYLKQYANLDRPDYEVEHAQGLAHIPYNNVESNGTLEQCIIDSRVSLVIETYTSDSHIVFSEKIFRALQLPRPWLLYCSPGAVSCLRDHGLDVLDDMVDHSYDHTVQHGRRQALILDQLATFVDRDYTQSDYARFDQACIHNQQLLRSWQQAWPDRLAQLLEQIQRL